jgi:hypothetical protein
LIVCHSVACLWVRITDKVRNLRRALYGVLSV